MVCVVALPPWLATIGASTASATMPCSCSWNRPSTEEARNAVARLTSSQLKRPLAMVQTESESSSSPFEDLLAHRVVDFSQRREVEILAHQFDQLRAQRAVERLDQVAHIRFVQVADQGAQARRVASLDRGGDLCDEFGANAPLFVAQRRRVGRRGGRGGGGRVGTRVMREDGDVFLVLHAALTTPLASLSPASTLRRAARASQCGSLAIEPRNRSIDAGT